MLLESSRNTETMHDLLSSALNFVSCSNASASSKESDGGFRFLTVMLERGI